MSLTNNDMVKLKEAADKIAAERTGEIASPVSIAGKIEGSYYEKRTMVSNDAAAILHQYGFATPMELKAELEIFWEKMGKKQMNGFLPVSMVAAAKNKPEQGKQEVQQQISPYIYEF